MSTLVTFYTAAHRQSFSQAGEYFNITHAAISNQMKRLEEWFGRKLFERFRRGLKLTLAGEEFLRTVDASLLVISAASQTLKVSQGRKQVSVAAYPSIATRWLVPALNDYMQHHPGVSVEVSYAEAFQRFSLTTPLWPSYWVDRPTIKETINGRHYHS